MLLLVFIFLGNSQPTYACSCFPPKDPYKISKAVFFGQLAEIAQKDNLSRRLLKFKVERYWKGPEEERLSVVTTAVAPCGYNFRVGEKYLIYAGEEKGQLETAPCRILHVDSAERDLQKLGKGKVPKQNSVSSTAPPNKALQLTAR